jgi:hypothetical protein
MCFPNGSVEEPGIECGDILVKEVATLGVDRFLGLGIGVIERLPVPTIGGNLTPCTSSFRDHIPEFLRIVSTAWETAAHADDGNGGRASHGYGRVQESIGTCLSCPII